MIFFDKNTAIAVVGASHQSAKYGYKVFAYLLNNGYQVAPVNHRGGRLLNQVVYRWLKDIPFPIKMVVMVVSPSASLQILKEMTALQIRQVWFQPGSENSELIEFCQNNQLDYQTNFCIMLTNSRQTSLG
ncbi:MAG TPA: CoA-binding protein [Candidatus Woesebacteria bacterium]|nr:CoA-binding protein [Candidatus Woesebacteria bacterium]